MVRSTAKLNDAWVRKGKPSPQKLLEALDGAVEAACGGKAASKVLMDPSLKRALEGAVIPLSDIARSFRSDPSATGLEPLDSLRKALSESKILSPAARKAFKKGSDEKAGDAEGTGGTVEIASCDAAVSIRLPTLCGVHLDRHLRAADLQLLVGRLV